MLPQELKEMDMWEEIVSLEHTKPIRCAKIKYFEDPTFTARVDWKVPEIPLIDLDEFIKNTKAGAKILTEPATAKMSSKHLILILLVPMMFLLKMNLSIP